MKQLLMFLLLFLGPITAHAGEQIPFDLVKMKQVYDNYTSNKHAGVTLVMGHPFPDGAFRKQIIHEQEAIKTIFDRHHVEDLLILYDPYTQVHATLIQLAAQHDEQRNDQQFLTDRELTISAKTQKPMKINYVAEWIKKTKPFEIELGPGVLSDAHRDQTLRITETGQIVMKGRAKERRLLAEIRAEFESKAGIHHKYTKEDDEFFFVIGYLKADPRLHSIDLQSELDALIKEHRELIHLTLKIDEVRVIAYDSYSLNQDACLWESPKLKFEQEVKLPQNTLLKTLQQVYHNLQTSYESTLFQEAI